MYVDNGTDKAVLSSMYARIFSLVSTWVGLFALGNLCGACELNRLRFPKVGFFDSTAVHRAAHVESTDLSHPFVSTPLSVCVDIRVCDLSVHVGACMHARA